MRIRAATIITVIFAIAACSRDGAPPEMPASASAPHTTRAAGFTAIQARAADTCKCEVRESTTAFETWASTTKDREALDWVGSACQFNKREIPADEEICKSVDTNQKRVPARGFIGGTLG